MSLLDNLNPEQLAAVTLPNQSALILAGAGSGKTRVLTTRIAWLIQTGNVSPAGILAVTFTNKAAKEMLTRISAMLPISTRGMWVGTFHGLCNRLLRAHHRDAGLPQLFQILDSADQLSLVKRVLKAMNVDEDRFAPKQVQYFINANKEEGKRASDAEAYDAFSRRYCEIYAAYDEQCQREGAVDFAELLLRSFELLSKNEILREHYQGRFRHILVDEFQDTNRLQYRWLKLLTGKDSVIFAVGDDDQCMAEGTHVTMADGRAKRIERIVPGDEVLSCYGPGKFKPSRVLKAHKRSVRGGRIRIRLASGRALTSTPEHTHLADYLLGETPQVYFTYLMYKRGLGYRLGTSQVYTRGQRKPMVGFRQRALQEHADALWIVGVHATENDARSDEILLSLRYGLPTLPFVPRKGGSLNGLVHDDRLIRRVYAEIDTDSAARRLMGDRGLQPDEPHHVPQTRNSNRRNINLTLCGDGRGASSLHRICVMGNDAAGKRDLEELGLSVRAAKRNSESWRYETSSKDFGMIMKTAERIRARLGGHIRLRAGVHSTPLRFMRADMVRPGMAMMGGDGKLDIVQEVERQPVRKAAVFDIDVEQTHNYVADGIVTHNSIYAFRGANVGNMADFERDFHVENVIRLERNYRSHGNILDAANALISNNRKRLGKNLWTAAGHGEPLRIYEAQTDGYEAHWLAEEVQALNRDGLARREIGVLYRSNAQSRILEHALFSAGISYRVYSGLRFFERMEIKHALAYLRLVASAEDDSAFLRVVNFPVRGIGARSLEALQDAARAGNTSLYNAVPRLAGKSGNALGAFAAMISALRREAEGLALPEIVEHMLAKSGLLAHFQAEKDGADRVENLQELINAAALFVQEQDEHPELAAFLAHAALEAGEHQAGEGSDALQLMTVHSAKGLEFQAVFVTGLEEGLFPHEQSRNEDDGLEEERRLMYVAITRARARLYLSFAQNRMLHGQTRYNVASRFLDEIPAGLVKWLTPRLTGQPMPEPVLASARDAAVPKSLPRATQMGWRIGQNVVHAKFGQGVIVNAEGQGTDARVQINFGRQGMKWLALEYAKLSAA